jgi:hypothetical protein
MNINIEILIKRYEFKIQEHHNDEYYVLINNNRSVILQCLLNLNDYNLILDNDLGLYSDQNFGLKYGELISILDKYFNKKKRIKKLKYILV